MSATFCATSTGLVLYRTLVGLLIMPAPIMPAPDMSGVDPGLQPTLIAMLYSFPGLALVVLLVRFWRKWIDNILGGGMTTPF
jgi:hypothetical protein